MGYGYGALRAKRESQGAFFCASDASVAETANQECDRERCFLKRGGERDPWSCSPMWKAWSDHRCDFQPFQLGLEARTLELLTEAA
jgi:hypothetical protein